MKDIRCRRFNIVSAAKIKVLEAMQSKEDRRIFRAIKKAGDDAIKAQGYLFVRGERRVQD